MNLDNMSPERLKQYMEAMRASAEQDAKVWLMIHEGNMRRINTWFRLGIAAICLIFLPPAILVVLELIYG